MAAAMQQDCAALQLRGLLPPANEAPPAQQKTAPEPTWPAAVQSGRWPAGEWGHADRRLGFVHVRRGAARCGQAECPGCSACTSLPKGSLTARLAAAAAPLRYRAHLQGQHAQVWQACFACPTLRQRPCQLVVVQAQDEKGRQLQARRQRVGQIIESLPRWGGRRRVLSSGASCTPALASGAADCPRSLLQADLLLPRPPQSSPARAATAAAARRARPTLGAAAPTAGCLRGRVSTGVSGALPGAVSASRGLDGFPAPAPAPLPPP